MWQISFGVHIVLRVQGATQGSERPTSLMGIKDADIRIKRMEKDMRQHDSSFQVFNWSDVARAKIWPLTVLYLQLLQLTSAPVYSLCHISQRTGSWLFLFPSPPLFSYWSLSSSCHTRSILFLPPRWQAHFLWLTALKITSKEQTVSTDRQRPGGREEVRLISGIFQFLSDRKVSLMCC